MKEEETQKINKDREGNGFGEEFKIRPTNKIRRILYACFIRIPFIILFSIKELFLIMIGKKK